MSTEIGPSFGGTILAFLFSDIEGSTQRWERHQQAMRVALARHDALMRAAMTAHGGRVFKTVGDAFCVAFATVPEAVAASIAAQRALAAEDFAAVEGIRVRIGIHAGPAEARDQDYFGPTLNRVARLMAASHGGQIVLSGAAAALLQGALPADASLKDLGRHRLKDLIEAEQVFQVLAADLPGDFAPLASLGAMPNNLPQQGTSFIGREEELAEVTSLLERYRLVTLLGSGGLGKTRLSLQVGAEGLERYPDGVWFVELAPLTDPDLLAPTVGKLFGLPSREGRAATDVVTGFMTHKKLLLILDNCEHLVAGAAAFADAVIRTCPGVSLLASSREALAIPGEHVVRVPMLPVPTDTDGLSAAAALEYPAVRLFVERAASSLGRFTLTDAEAGTIAAICRRLDGIALAIELAAPRLKMLNPAQLLVRLDDRFRLLTGGSRAALPRQQTLRGLIDWSHDLLPEGERVLMRRLAVFADGWTLDAAGGVASGEGIEDWEIFDLLASLVDKSLVVADRSGIEPRFRFLESTRHYAAEKLEEAGEARFRARHASYFVEFFKRGEIIWETTSTKVWLEVYGPELDNLRAALDWAYGPQGDRALGLALFAYSFPLWRERGLEVERLRRAEFAVATLEPTTPPAIAARIYRQWGSRTAMGVASTVPILRKAVEASREAGEPALLGICLAILAGALPREASIAEGTVLLAEAQEIAEHIGPSRLRARVYNTLGTIAGLALDFEGERAQYERSLAAAREIGDTAGIVALLVNLAGSYGTAQDYDRAAQLGREAISATREASLRPAEMLATVNLSVALHRAGDFDAALEAARSGVRLGRTQGEAIMVAMAGVIVILAALRLGEPVLAARLWGWADAALLAESYELADEEPVLAGELEAGLNAALGEEARVLLQAEGAALSLDQAVALALSIGATA